jgi:hypothetical protein
MPINAAVAASKMGTAGKVAAVRETEAHQRDMTGGDSVITASAVEKVAVQSADRGFQPSASLCSRGVEDARAFDPAIPAPKTG